MPNLSTDYLTVRKTPLVDFLGEHGELLPRIVAINWLSRLKILEHGFTRSEPLLRWKLRGGVSPNEMIREKKPQPKGLDNSCRIKIICHIKLAGRT